MTASSERQCGPATSPARARYQPLVAVALAVAAGIAVDYYATISWPAWCVAGVVLLTAWCWLWRRQRDAAAAAVLLLAAATLGGAWHHQQWNDFAVDHLGRFAREADRPVCVEAIALRSPVRMPPRLPDPLEMIPRKDVSKLDVEVTRLRDGAGWRSASGHVNVLVSGTPPRINSGDRLLIYARLMAPSPVCNPGEFNMAAYLRADRRLCQLRANHAAGITVIDAARSWSLRRWIDELRQYGRRLFDRHLSPRYAGLAGAVLLGARDQVDPEQTEAFFETGTIHILVVSGLNVAMLAGTLWFVLRRLRLPRGVALSSVCATALVYMLLTDAEPPVVRATILVLGTCLASAWGRPTLAFNTLAAAALAVLAIRPHDLFSVSAQLSFLCVAGLVWFGPLREEAVKRRRDQLVRLIDEAGPRWRAWLRFVGREAWELTITSAVVWVLVAPLIMARFHVLAFLGIPLNPLLWLPVEVAMVSGFVLLLTGWFPPLGALCGWMCNLSLATMNWLVATAKRLPESCFWTPGPDDWWLLGFYGAIAAGAMFPRWRPPWRWCWALLSVWITLGFGVSHWRQTRGDLDCTFLSVGHGLAVAMRLPSGQTVLYDAGQCGSGKAATQRIAGFLWSQGIVHLDAVIVSHPDADHYNGLPGLLDRFHVGKVYVSPIMFRAPDAALERLYASIAATRTPLAVLKAGDRLGNAANGTLRVLHPPPGGIPAKDNANSIVLAVEYAGRCVLLTGDLEEQGMDLLLATPPWPCDVLLAPHHGSRRSQPDQLLAWAKPPWAVVSSGPIRSFHTAEAVYAAAQCRALHTALQGAIHFRIGRETFEVHTYRHRPDAPLLSDQDSDTPELQEPQAWVL